MKKLLFLTMVSVFTLLLGINNGYGQYDYVRTANGDTIIKPTEEKILHTIKQDPEKLPGTKRDQLMALANPRTVVRIADTEKKVYSRFGISFTKDYYKNTIVFIPEGGDFHEKSTPERSDNNAKYAWSIITLYLAAIVLFYLGGRKKKLKTKFKLWPFGMIVIAVFALAIGTSFGWISLGMFLMLNLIVGCVYAISVDSKKTLTLPLPMVIHGSYLIVLILRWTVDADGKFDFEFEYSMSYFIGMMIAIPIVAFCLGYFFTKSEAQKARILLKKKEKEKEKEELRRINEIIGDYFWDGVMAERESRKRDRQSKENELNDGNYTSG